MLKPRHRIRAAFITLLWIGGFCFGIAAAGSAVFDRISKSIDASPRRLIYHTNHKAVLQACKEVLRDPQAAGFPKPVNGQAIVNGSQGGQPPANLPAVLKNLHFEFMVIDQHTATIYFGGGIRCASRASSGPPHLCNSVKRTSGLLLPLHLAEFSASGINARHTGRLRAYSHDKCGGIENV
jgi:hypothetical protein